MPHTESQPPSPQRDSQSPTPDLSVPHIGTWSFRFDLPPAITRPKKIRYTYTAFECALIQLPPTKYKDITYLQYETFASWYALRYPHGKKLPCSYQFLASLNLPRQILDEIDMDESDLATAVDRCQEEVERAKQTSTNVEDYWQVQERTREQLMILVGGSDFDGGGADGKYRECGWRRSGSRREVERLEEEEQDVEEEPKLS